MRALIILASFFAVFQLASAEGPTVEPQSVLIDAKADGKTDAKADVGRSYECLAVYEGYRRDRYFRGQACGKKKARKRALRKCRRNVRYPADCYIDYCESDGWCIDF